MVRVVQSSKERVRKLHYCFLDAVLIAYIINDKAGSFVKLHLSLKTSSSLSIRHSQPFSVELSHYFYWEGF